MSAFRYGHDVLKLAIEAPFIDFGSFYAFAWAFQAGADPFDRAELRRISEMLGVRVAGTPPTFTPAGYLIFLPFTGLPYSVARLLWLAAGQVSLLVGLWAVARCVRPSALLGALGLFVVFAYQPILEDIALGNLNLLVFALVSLGVLGHLRGHVLAAAVPLSWAVNLKLPYLLLIPFLAWTGSRATAALSLLLASAWAGLGVALLGSQWLDGYLRFLAVGSDPLHAWAKNLSPHAILHRVARSDGPDPAIEAAAIALALGVVAGLMRPTRGCGRSPEATLAAWATATAALPLVSPLTEEVHLVVSLLPLLVVIARAEQLGTRWEGILLLAATVLLGSRYSVEAFPAFSRGLASLAYGGKVAGAAALAIVAARLCRRS